MQLQAALQHKNLTTTNYNVKKKSSCTILISNLRDRETETETERKLIGFRVRPAFATAQNTI